MKWENDFGDLGLSQVEMEELDEQSWEKLFYPGGVLDLISGEDDRFAAGRLFVANF
jgi:hypothetical protein